MTQIQSRAAHAYERAMETLAPARQIVMLYDGAARWILRARGHIERGEVEARFHATQRAGAIIDALHGCLDFQAGGSVAPLLDRYYTYLSLRLQQINVQNNPGICDELLNRLADMRASWASLTRTDATS